MSSERRTLVVVLAVLVVLVGLLFLWPSIEQELAPQPQTAWVAIQPEGSDEAVVGTVELAVDTPFQLHAVLEATRRDGSKIFYTEAPALRLPGGPVPAEDLARWDRPQEVRVLWFTVEGALPYLELDPGETLERFRMTELLRPDWPQSWSVPGTLDPANDNSLVRSGARGDNPFGTQRYHVRIELFGRETQLVPQERYRSPGAEALRPPELGSADGRASESFSAVIASLPGTIGPASALFGLTQIEPPPGEVQAMQREIRELTRHYLAFSRLTALGSLLSAAGETLGSLDWRQVSLDAGLPWAQQGEEVTRGVARGVARGNLLRVGDRVVILYRDEGESGTLDRQDLCFDYARGAAVRPLGDVFVGGGEVELASLGD